MKLLWSLLLPVCLQAASLSIDAQSFMVPVGNSIQVPVQIDVSAPEAFRSLELQMQFPAGWQVQNLIAVPGLLGTWSVTASSQISGNQLDLALAADADLVGTGLFFMVEVIPTSTGACSFPLVIANEGLLSFSLDSQLLSITRPAPLAILPGTSQSLLVTETVAFSSSNGTAPLTWSNDGASVGSVDPTGLYTAVSGGTDLVHVIDVTGLQGTSANIEVFDMELLAGSFSGTAGASFSLPIQLNNPGAQHFSSFEFRLDLGSERLSLTGINQVGTISQGWSLISSQQDGRYLWVSASTEQAGGSTASGLLLEVLLSSSTGNGLNSDLSFSETLVDENYRVRNMSGLLMLSASGSFSVTPSTAVIHRGQSLSASYSGTPQLPVSWSTTNPAVGSIDASGLFSAHSGGTCQLILGDSFGQVVNSATWTVVDLDLQLGSVAGAVGEQVLCPVLVEDLSGFAVNSFEGHMSWNPSQLQFVSLETAGSLVTGWSELLVQSSPGDLELVAAGPVLLSSAAELVFIRFLILSGSPVGTTIPIQFNSFLLNEGDPVIRIFDGSVLVTNPAIALNISTSGNSVILDWNLVPGALSYLLYSADQGFGPWTLETTVPTNTLTLTGELAQPQRFYLVTADMP